MFFSKMGIINQFTYLLQMNRSIHVRLYSYCTEPVYTILNRQHAQIAITALQARPNDFNRIHPKITISFLGLYKKKKNHEGFFLKPILDTLLILRRHVGLFYFNVLDQDIAREILQLLHTSHIAKVCRHFPELYLQLYHCAKWNIHDAIHSYILLIKQNKDGRLASLENILQTYFPVQSDQHASVSYEILHHLTEYELLPSIFDTIRLVLKKDQIILPNQLFNDISSITTINDSHHILGYILHQMIMIVDSLTQIYGDDYLKPILDITDNVSHTWRQLKVIPGKIYPGQEIQIEKIVYETSQLKFYFLNLSDFPGYVGVTETECYQKTRYIHTIQHLQRLVLCSEVVQELINNVDQTVGMQESIENEIPQSNHCIDEDLHILKPSSNKLLKKKAYDKQTHVMTDYPQTSLNRKEKTENEEKHYKNIYTILKEDLYYDLELRDLHVLIDLQQQQQQNKFFV